MSHLTLQHRMQLELMVISAPCHLVCTPGVRRSVLVGVEGRVPRRLLRISQATLDLFLRRGWVAVGGRGAMLEYEGRLSRRVGFGRSVELTLTGRRAVVSAARVSRETQREIADRLSDVPVPIAEESPLRTCPHMPPGSLRYCPWCGGDAPYVWDPTLEEQS